MNISHVRTFLEVVETGNLNKAAERLNVTQSTVSTRLDALEDAMGQTLLVRSRRGAQMTRAGFAFQRHAELIVRTWEQARKEVGLRPGFSALFSFACDRDLWESAGSAWIDMLRDEHDDIAFEAWPGSPAEISAWLASGLTDAALVADPPGGSGLQTAEVARERLVQVASVERAAQDWDPDYIFNDMGPAMRLQHAATWPGDNTPRMTFGSSRWALDELLARGGSAYLPWRLAEPHVAGGTLFPVDGAPELHRTLHLVWRTASLDIHPWIREEAGRLAAILA